MQRISENKIILVVRRTRIDDLIKRFNTLAQAKFYVEHLGADFSDYLQEDEQYKKIQLTAEACLRGLGHLQVLDRSFLPNFIFGNQDIIVVLGQDGLVANTIKYLSGQKVIGVNPDCQRWEGVLLPFQVDDLKNIILDVFAQRRPIKEVTMAKASLNNGQNLYAVNDLFIGHQSHMSARYEIQLDQYREQHSSSGIIVSTGLGSTGWFKSVLTGALNISHAFHHQNIESKPIHFAWDADYLYFSVREPFLSVTSSADLVFGQITMQRPMKLISQMAENGVIFSDGIEQDFLEFNSGTQAIISVAEKRGYLVV